MKLSQELKQLQKQWAKTKASTTGTRIPDGTYDVTIVDARLGRNRNSQKIQVEMVLQFLTKKYRNRTLTRYNTLETESNLKWFKTDLKKLGIVPPKNILNIPKYLEKTIGLKVSITIKSNGNFVNIFFNEVLDGEEDDE